MLGSLMQRVDLVSGHTGTCFPMDMPESTSAVGRPWAGSGTHRRAGGPPASLPSLPPGFTSELQTQQHRWGLRVSLGDSGPSEPW